MALKQDDVRALAADRGSKYPSAKDNRNLYLVGASTALATWSSATKCWDG